MKNYTLSLLLIFSISTLWAQPVNDDCSGAIDLTAEASNTLCSNLLTYNNTGANVEGVFCYFGRSVWFKFRMPIGKVVNIQSRQNGMGWDDSLIEVFRKETDCSDLNFINCYDRDNALDGSDHELLTLTNDDVDESDSVYFVVFNPQEDSEGNFDLCLSFLDPPANDECEEAIDISANIGNESCSNPVKVSTFGASDSNFDFGVNDSCNEDDVWYVFTAPSTGVYVVETSQSDMFFNDTELSIFILDAGSDCSSMDAIPIVTCFDENNFGPGDNSQVSIEVEQNQIVYISVVEDDHPLGQMDLCVYTRAAQIANDNCAGAIDISNSIGVNDCSSPVAATNMNATYAPQYEISPDNFDSDCTFLDVWFKFTVPEDGDYYFQTFQVMGSAFEDPEVSVYRTDMDDCTIDGSIEECYDDDETNDTDHEHFELEDLVMGEIIYIRIAEDDGEQGEFNLCVTRLEEPANDDCDGAIDITNSIGVGNCTTLTRANTLGSTFGDDDCEEPGVWFKFTAPEQGIYYMETQQVGDIDDVELSTFMATNGDCSILLDIDECQDSDNSSITNNHEAIILDLEMDEVIYLFVNPYEDYTPGLIDICIYRVDPLPTNGDCSTAVDLTPNMGTEYCSDGTETVFLSAAGNSGFEGCNGDYFSDAWYQVTVPSSGNMGIGFFADVDFGDGSLDFFMGVYTGSCGDLDEETCEEYNSNSVAILSEFEPDEVLYIHLYQQDRDDIQMINICAFEYTDDQNNEDCDTAQDLSTDCDSPTITGNGLLLDNNEGCEGSESDQYYSIEVGDGDVPYLVTMNYLPGGMTDFSYSLLSHDDCDNEETLIDCRNVELDNEGLFEVVSMTEPGSYLLIISADNGEESGALSICTESFGMPDICDGDPLYREVLEEDFRDGVDNSREMRNTIFTGIPANAGEAVIQVLGNLDIGDDDEFFIFSGESGEELLRIGDQENDCQGFFETLTIPAATVQEWAVDGDIELMIFLTDDVDFFCEEDQENGDGINPLGDRVFISMTICTTEVLAPIPTLSTWAMIILGLLLSIIGICSILQLSSSRINHSKDQKIQLF